MKTLFYSDPALGSGEVCAGFEAGQEHDPATLPANPKSTGFAESGQHSLHCHDEEFGSKAPLQSKSTLFRSPQFRPDSRRRPARTSRDREDPASRRFPELRRADPRRTPGQNREAMSAVSDIRRSTMSTYAQRYTLGPQCNRGFEPGLQAGLINCHPKGAVK